MTHASTWAKPAYSAIANGESLFDLHFRLGPLKLGCVALELSTVDLGDVAISGKDIDPSQFSGAEVYLRSVPDRLCLNVLLQDGDVLFYPFYRYDRCWVATDGDFEAYMASFSKTTRKGLRRRIRQLVTASGGELDVRYFSTGAVMADYHADARALSVKTFQERLMNDGLPAGEAFLQDMIRKADQDRCYGSILYLDNQPVSYLHFERQGTGWTAVYGGFDPVHARLSPGTVHLLSVLEHAFEDPDCAVFDFGAGHCDYKPFFATHKVPAADVLILQRNLRNRLIVGVHRMLAAVTARAVDMADALRLKTAFRQRIRGR